MAAPILNTIQPFQTSTTQPSTIDVGENNFNATVSIIKILPLAFLCLLITKNYFCPTPINANILEPLTQTQNPELPNDTLTQPELPEAPPEGSQAPSITAPPSITATLGMVDQNPLFSN